MLLNAIDDGVVIFECFFDAVIDSETVSYAVNVHRENVLD